MPLFDYRAIAPDGAMQRGQILAADAAAVIRQLQGQGWLPVEAEPAATAAASPVPIPSIAASGAVPLRPLAVATRELALVLGAGQTLEQSLDLLVRHTAPDRLRPRLGSVLDRLRAGSGFADALDAAGGFPPFYVAMVRAGEAGGTLEATLARLADLLEQSLRVRDRLISALIYPAILIAVAVASVLVLLLAVVPQFAPLFASSPHALPTATRLVLGASALLQQGWPLAAIALTGGLAILALSRRLRSPTASDRWVLQVPVIGPLVTMTGTARLSRTLAMLLHSGLPLPAALALARQVVGNRTLAASVDAMGVGVREGRGLSASLPADTPLPVLAIHLLRVGEECGRLEEVLLHLARIYDEKTETGLARLLALFEPVCVLTLSVFIGGIIVSILLAVVSINDLAF